MFLSQQFVYFLGVVIFFYSFHFSMFIINYVYNQNIIQCDHLVIKDTVPNFNGPIDEFASLVIHVK